MNTETKNCCICGDDFAGWGNNPEPFKGNTCCDDCNDRFVVPTRMCLGRGYNDESVLLLLATIAELGKCLKKITVESRSMANKPNEQNRKPF
jgi:hypothetical protein